MKQIGDEPTLRVLREALEENTRLRRYIEALEDRSGNHGRVRGDNDAWNVYLAKMELRRNCG